MQGVRRGFSRFRKGRITKKISPTESLINLIDVMLIFACGLMVSIVMLWNLELHENPADYEQNNAYQEIGQVYEDPETGKIYIIKSAD